MQPKEKHNLKMVIGGKATPKPDLFKRSKPVQVYAQYAINNRQSTKSSKFTFNNK